MLLAGVSLAAVASSRAEAAQAAMGGMQMAGMSHSMPMAKNAAYRPASSTASPKTMSAGGTHAMDASVATLPVVTISNVVVDNDSAKIEFQPVAGAADYRVYDISNPTFVKYAGIRQSLASDNSTINSIPSLEVEWNGLTPGTSAQLVVEALNAEGPNAPGNLYDDNNSALYPGSQSSMPGMSSLLGTDEGMTNDGLTSINGQGSYTNVPVAIARSTPFTVTPTGTPALPSGSDATQVIYDTFSSGTITTTDPNPNNDGLSTDYTLQSDEPWDIDVRNSDVTNTKPFIMGHHFMDVLFDGGTPGTNNPLHQCHGALALSPEQTADISGGKMLHVTMEVDAHMNDRRWVGIDIAPVDDPITNFYPPIFPTDHMSKSNSVFVVGVTEGSTTANLYGADANGNDTNIAIAGAAGQATNVNMRTMDGKTAWNGRGLDDRSRIDLFVTQTHYAEYEDGVLQESYDIPGGLPFSQVKVTFVHYVYHSALMLQEEEQYEPYEKFWINSVPYSDERHWDNMGYEVLPSTTSWSTLPSRIATPDPLNQDGTPVSSSGGTGTGTGGTGTGGTGTGTGGTGTGGTGTGTGGTGTGGSGTGGTGTGGTGTGTGGTTTSDTTATVTGVIKKITSQTGYTSIYATVKDAVSGKTIHVKTPETMLATVAVSAYGTNTPVTITYTISTTSTTNNGKIQSIVLSK